MSLKGFHILFIILAFLCSAGFWAWAVLDAERAQEMGVVALGNFSGSLALALLVYGLWFAIVKSKTIRV
jgi:O-antigen ligase